MNIINSVLTRLAGTITHVRTEQKVIALTFDDGPHPLYTPQLLDVLDAHGAKGTFFVLGDQVTRHGGIVRRMLASGHAVGCHSYDHPSFPTVSGAERRSQIRRWEQAMIKYAEWPAHPKIFRPPFGHQTWRSYFDARLLGYQVVTWRCLAEDWLDNDAQWLSDKLLKAIKPGHIVLLHDNLYNLLNPRYADRGATLACVDELLKQLGKTFQFVTVPQLLEYGRVKRTVHLRRPDAAFLARLQRADVGMDSPV